MTVFQKLEKRLREELHIPIIPGSLRRTYAGYWQRRAGAYVWTAQLPIGDIGSSETATECLKAKKLEISNDGYVWTG